MEDHGGSNGVRMVMLEYMCLLHVIMHENQENIKTLLENLKARKTTQPKNRDWNLIDHISHSISNFWVWSTCGDRYMSPLTPLIGISEKILVDCS